MRLEIDNEFVLIDELAWKHGGMVTISVDGIDRFAVVFSRVGERSIVQHDLLNADGTVAERITTMNEEGL